MPINLVERVEIYRAVVPTRFGADALGGAVNVVSNRNLRGSHASASLQAGSFGTSLLTLSAQHLDERSGWFNRVSGFFDRADNNYPMNVEVADARGRGRNARVYRFHDAYSAQGANLETGIVEKSWAKRVLLRGFVTNYEKEIQHNLFNPYGNITLGELSAGGTARYENDFGERFSVDAVAGYSYGMLKYVDVGECVYDWFGQCLRERAQPGERNGRPEDQRYGEHNVYGRVNLDYRLQAATAATSGGTPRPWRSRARSKGRNITKEGYNLESIAVVRGNRMYSVFTLLNYDTWEFLAKPQYLAVYDLDKDEIIDIVEESRCPQLFNRPFVDESGDIYFSGWVWSAGLALTSDYPKSCALRVKKGDDTFDPDWQLNFGDVTDGRQGAMLRYLGKGQALLDVFHAERVEIDDKTDPEELANTPNWRLWKIDLEKKTGAPIESLDFKAGGFTDITIDGRTFLMVPNEDYSETKAVDLIGDETKDGFKVRGSSYDVRRIR